MSLALRDQLKLGSMGRTVYLPTFYIVDLYIYREREILTVFKLVGKYTIHGSYVKTNIAGWNMKHE